MKLDTSYIKSKGVTIWVLGSFTKGFHMLLNIKLRLSIRQFV